MSKGVHTGGEPEILSSEHSTQEVLRANHPNPSTSSLPPSPPLPPPPPPSQNDLQALLSARDAEIVSLRSKLATSQKQLNQELTGVRQQLSENQSIMSKQLSKIKDLEEQLKTTRTNHEKINEKLTDIQDQRSNNNNNNINDSMSEELQSKNTEIERLQQELTDAQLRARSLMKELEVQKMVNQAIEKINISEEANMLESQYEKSEKLEKIEQIRAEIREKQEKFREIIAAKDTQIEQLKLQLLQTQEPSNVSPRTYNRSMSSLSSSSAAAASPLTLEKIDESTSTHDLDYESAFLSPAHNLHRAFASNISTSASTSSSSAPSSFSFDNSMNASEDANSNEWRDRVLALQRECDLKSSEIKSLKSEMDKWKKERDENEDIDFLRAQIAVMKAQHLELNQQLSRANNIIKRLEAKMGLGKDAKTTDITSGLIAQSAETA